MRKYALIPVITLGVMMLLLRTVPAQESELKFKAWLSGTEAVPSVMTNASGMASFAASKTGAEMTYTLAVKDLANVTAAHIHLGKKGENGPPVVFLFKGPFKQGQFNGTLGEGIITANDLFGPLKGKPLSDLIAMMKKGETYVNVHTTEHPEGEIRGQIVSD